MVDWWNFAKGARNLELRFDVLTGHTTCTINNYLRTSCYIEVRASQQECKAASDHVVVIRVTAILAHWRSRAALTAVRLAVHEERSLLWSMVVRIGKKRLWKKQRKVESRVRGEAPSNKLDE